MRSTVERKKGCTCNRPIVIPGIGTFDCKTDAAYRLTGNEEVTTTWRGLARKHKITYEHAVVIDMKRRVYLLQQRLIRLDPKKKIAKDAKGLIGGKYCGINFCRECGKAFECACSNHVLYTALRKQQVLTAYCSDRCSDIAKKRYVKKAKKKCRSAGKYDRGKHVHRAKKFGVSADHGITARAVAVRDGMKCQVCGRKVQAHKGKGWQPKGWTIGHIVALSDGGKHAWDNVQCECSECNTRKGVHAFGQLRLAV